jgi:hypothetical protein
MFCKLWRKSKIIHRLPPAKKGEVAPQIREETLFHSSWFGLTPIFELLTAATTFNRQFMIFGSTFSGQIKTQNGQWIETRVHAFILPVSCPYSLLVTERDSTARKGLPLKTLPLSVVAMTIRSIVTVLAFCSVAIVLANWGEMLWMIPVSLAAIALFVYVWFHFGKTSTDEMLVREAFFRSTGFSVLPEWLSGGEAASLHTNLKRNYISHLQGVKMNDLDEARLYQLLAFKAFEYARTKDESVKEKMEQIQELLRPSFSFVKK